MLSKLTHLVVPFLIAACSAEMKPTTGQEKGDIVSGEIGTALDGFLTELALQGFSGAVLVAKDQEIILQKGYGLADRARGTPNTAHTVFNICSMSKVFTSAAVLHLEMQGKLKVGETLGEHLGEFPAEKSSATIHDLLTHTAGLVVAGTEVDNEDRRAFIDAMKSAAIESIPGEEFRYTNVGYSLLAALVEEVSGQSFESYVEEYLLRPAGMRDTTFLGPNDESLVRNLALGYHDEDATEPVDLGPFVWGYRGAGGMMSTLEDLYKWELALQNHTVLSARATEKMLTAYFGDEGYGWHVAETVQGKIVHHRGCGNPGFEGQYARYPDDRATVLLTSNNRDGWRRRIWEGIEGILF